MAISHRDWQGAVIVGYGESIYAKRPERSLLGYLGTAIHAALESARLEKAAVDGLAVSSFQLYPDNVTTVAEHFGMELAWSFQGAHGGASGIVGLLRAVRAIQAGDVEVVVCASADTFTVARHMALMGKFNAAMRDYLAPYGFGGTNGLFALVERRHSFEYGTRKDQLGKLAVTQRQHARLNPNALLRDTLTLEDYLEAPLIADPIRLYDCVLPCSGAEAIVVVSESYARDLNVTGIKILEGGERHNYQPERVINLATGLAELRPRLFGKTARISHADIDIVQLYDDYPIMTLIQLEDLGFSEKGRGGPFIEMTDLSLQGELPINTGGGQLSCGQAGAAGGMIGLVEGIRQLRQEAGERQVVDSSVCLVTGFGMVGYGRGLSSSAVILSNE